MTSTPLQEVLRPTTSFLDVHVGDTKTLTDREQIAAEIGFEAGIAAVHAAGLDLAKAARPIWKHPRYAEIEARRVPDHLPCSRRCRSCSRCIHSLAWYRRGQRDFLGVDTEGPTAWSAS